MPVSAGADALNPYSRWQPSLSCGYAVAAMSELLQPGHNCSSVARATRAALLVDGEAYFNAFMQAAARAERSIMVLAWDFDSRTVLKHGEGSTPDLTLGDFLNGLARRRRRLKIHILDWDYPMVFGTEREFPPHFGFTWKPHRRVKMRYDNMHPLGASHHQKIVVIDNKVAFVGGIDLTTRRWDTPAHEPEERRRMIKGSPYPPFHDLVMAVDGAAAQAVGQVARERWKRVTRRTLRAPATDGDPWPPELPVAVSDVEVGVSLTLPAVDDTRAVRHIERLYVDMIAGARRHIYIENQYFTSHVIGDALERRLGEADGPEIVVVTRLLSHGWLEEMTMSVLRTRLIQRLRAADRHGRFEVYCPYRAGLPAGTCIDVHSKMIIVDDTWLRIGSANLSNRSMGLDTECDLTLAAASDAQRDALRRFRLGLLAEHTGATADQAAAALERGGMHAAIAALNHEERALQPLRGLTDLPDALMAAISISDPERPVALERLVAEFASADDAVPARRGPRWSVLIGIALVLGSLAAAWRYTPLSEIATADNLTSWARDLSRNPWSPLVLVLSYTPASFVMFPRPLITLAAVIAFGAWAAFGLAMGGILIAASLCYMIGRRLSRNAVRRIAGERLHRVCQAVKRGGILTMISVRVVPIAPFIVTSMACGAFRVRYRDFAVGTLIGMLPGTLVATVFGDTLQRYLESPEDINGWLLLPVLGIFAVAMYALSRYLKHLSAKELPPDQARRTQA